MRVTSFKRRDLDFSLVDYYIGLSDYSIDFDFVFRFWEVSLVKSSLFVGGMLYVFRIGGRRRFTVE